MIVIVRNKKRLEIKRYKIFGFLYVLINKLKGNEVGVIYEKDIWNNIHSNILLNRNTAMFVYIHLYII